MHKLLFSFLMIVVWWLLHAMQLEEETALGTLHEGKRAVDRAAHAAAQQMDELKLEEGTVSIDSARAEATARAYLAANLRLAADLSPLEGGVVGDGARDRRIRRDQRAVRLSLYVSQFRLQL
ncbi:hypothetical protein OMP38_14365 [Cohnella ginsengisoli]|uniref:Uncharacterized protein n=1 Tax=Cohnella ginsengisoli TaxID=425004 RepID=A0A9X4QNT6_9BACL|nr:hypothetical protein [Cohnella ginsengisoli]MDG0791900.1 hypothetical protein [Cohnella ginsengisoli]